MINANKKKKRISAKVLFALALMLAATTLFGCGSICGDLVCSTGETVESCARDCSICGDGYCINPETVDTCTKDCSKCGDLKCTGPETYNTCPQDCPNSQSNIKTIPSNPAIGAKTNQDFSPGDKITLAYEVPYINSTIGGDKILSFQNSGYKYLVKECALYNFEGTLENSAGTNTLPLGSYGQISKIEKTNNNTFVYSNWMAPDGTPIGYGAVDDNQECLSDYAKTIPRGTSGILLEEMPEGTSGTQPSYVEGENYWLASLIIEENSEPSIVWVLQSAMQKK